MFKIVIILSLSSFVCAREEKSIFKKCNERKNCNIDPDEYLDIPQIIRRHGYPSESHTVQTEDGYLLGLHRIPGTKDGKRGGAPVLLQHGLLGSSADYVLNGNNSLAFTLADEGYDVWLGNCRGNTYSRAHVSLSTWSAQFWNFSFHEMGLYDLPAVLYHISNTTGMPGQINYVGHSMGTTQFFVLSSVNPQVAKNVKLMIALAPVAYMTHIRSPLRYLSYFVKDLQWLEKYLNLNEFLPHWKLFDFLAYDCNRNNGKKICQNLFFIICGFNKDEFNLDILSNVISHEPSGASTKTFLHYAQEIKNGGDFQQYDYGPKGNLIKYNSTAPPQYKLENIKRPIYLMYSDGDTLASSIDVERLSKKLVNLKGLYKVPLEVFDHVDYIYGKDAYNLVYQPILKILKNTTDF